MPGGLAPTLPLITVRVTVPWLRMLPSRRPVDVGMTAEDMHIKRKNVYKGLESLNDSATLPKKCSQPDHALQTLQEILADASIKTISDMLDC